MQLVSHWVVLVWAIDKVSEQVAHLISGHLPPTGVHSEVSAHSSRFEVRMRWRYKAILSCTSCVRLCALEGQMPVASAIQTGVVYVRCPMRASAHRSSWPPTPPWCSPSERAVCVVVCTPTCDARIR